MTWPDDLPLDRLYDVHAVVARNTDLSGTVWPDRPCEADLCLMRCHADQDVVVSWRWMS